MRPVLHLLRNFGTIFAFAALSACSTVHYPVNPPLAEVRPDDGYRMQGLVRNAGDEELLVVLTFSGGGSRAAALAYGVLEELRRQHIVWRGQRKRLLDEVDLVYGVSGGSITAAYYALVGERIFSEFERRFLARDLQGQLIDTIFFSATNYWRLGSPRFGRGELLQEQLDDALFEGATFADLAARRSGPFTVVSAADMGSGARFDFTQEYFDLLCSDLARFPLARAVAASNSVPLVFAPITLWNYAGDCGYQPSAALAAGSVVAPRGLRDTRAEQLTRDLASYLDRGRRPYIHLIDGGVADNLALRGLLDAEALVGGERLTQKLRLQRVRKALFVMVDAGTDSRRAADASANTPALRDVIDALTDIPIRRLSGETHLLVSQASVRWRHEAGAAVTGRATPVELYFVDVALRALPDAEERRELLALPTTLFLPKQQVQKLRDAAARLVRGDPDLQRLLREIGVRGSD